MLLVLLTGVCSCDGGRSGKHSEKPNVLFIICDDLNDAVTGFGGHPQARTPNIDALAKSGVRFMNAHSNNPVCGPSRASLWTGYYPHTTGYYGYNQNVNQWRDNPTMQDAVTLFEHFYNHGYDVLGTGKIFHDNQFTKELFRYKDDRNGFGVEASFGPWAWDGKTRPAAFVPHPSMQQPWGGWGFETFAPLSDVPEISAQPEKDIPGFKGWFDNGKPFRYVNEKDRDLMTDELSAEWIKERLQEDYENSFFMAVGLMRPHCPWVAPKKYFDMFPLDSIQLPPYLKNDLEDCGSYFRNIQQKSSTRFERLKEAYPGDEGWKRWIQGYLACVSFVDDQVGKIMEALEESAYSANTIVVFTSDHGFHMGEKDMLHKRTVWERSTRVPLIIRAPGISKVNGRCNNPVSLVDCYPTLVDLCGLDEQPNREKNDVPIDGYSLRSLLKNPGKGKWKGPDFALSSIYGSVPVEKGIPGKIENQHFTICSSEWRYVLYSNGEEELYDLINDPNEWENLANNPEYNGIVRENYQMLKGFLEEE